MLKPLLYADGNGNHIHVCEVISDNVDFMHF
jgi:hypothetical protein